MDVTTSKRCLPAAEASGLLSPTTPTYKSTETSYRPLKSLCDDISALVKELERRCGTAETKNQDWQTRAMRYRQKLLSERKEYDLELNAKQSEIGSLAAEIARMKATQDDLRSKSVLHRNLFQAEREAKNNALQDLQDAHRLSEQLSHDVNVGKKINKDLDLALQQAQERAREQLVEAERSAQTSTQKQTMRIEDLEAQLAKQSMALDRANFYVSVYHTTLVVAYGSFEPVNGQPVFMRIMENVFEQKIQDWTAMQRTSMGGLVGDADQVAGVGRGGEDQKPLASQVANDELSSDCDELTLPKCYRKRAAREEGAGLLQKRICMGVDGGEGGQTAGNEHDDAAVDDYKDILSEEEDEEIEDARSDDDEDEEWLP